MTGPGEAVTISTSDGETLEALWALPSGRPVAVAVACHPHPLYGGSMHANVVHRLFTDLPDHDVAVLRFNFRGVGGSSGTHDDGRAEQHDVRAAIDAATTRFPDVRLLLAGYSFGGDLCLTVDHEAITGRLAVSPPLRVVPPDQMTASAAENHPVRVITGADDGFRAPAEVEDLIGHWPTFELETVDGVDHFWMRHLDRVTTAALALLGDDAWPTPSS
jgi:alpha/beta superfamily hydrolase